VEVEQRIDTLACVRNVERLCLALLEKNKLVPISPFFQERATWYLTNQTSERRTCIAKGYREREEEESHWLFLKLDIVPHLLPPSSLSALLVDGRV
jgi:hypothetical protein